MPRLRASQRRRLSAAREAMHWYLCCARACANGAPKRGPCARMAGAASRGFSLTRRCNLRWRSLRFRLVAQSHKPRERGSNLFESVPRFMAHLTKRSTYLCRQYPCSKRPKSDGYKQDDAPVIAARRNPGGSLGQGGQRDTSVHTYTNVNTLGSRVPRWKHALPTICACATRQTSVHTSLSAAASAAAAAASSAATSARD